MEITHLIAVPSPFELECADLVVLLLRMRPFHTDESGCLREVVCGILDIHGILVRVEDAIGSTPGR